MEDRFYSKKSDKDINKNQKQKSLKDNKEWIALRKATKAERLAKQKKKFKSSEFRKNRKNKENQIDKERSR